MAIQFNERNKMYLIISKGRIINFALTMSEAIELKRYYES